MQVNLIGLGSGQEETRSFEAQRALERAGLVLGAERLLRSLPAVPGQTRIAAARPEEIAACLQQSDAKDPCVVFSGDTGFYSGADGLLRLLRKAGIAWRILPGLSSVQLLSARLGKPWQDWVLCSAHGRPCDPIAALMTGKPAFFLTGGGQTPASLCREIRDAGLGALQAVVGEKLGCAAPRPCERPGGIPDEAFCRGEVPMTKQELRAVILAKLAPGPEDTVWDVGAGTGSVSVELALAARRGQTWAVDAREEACALIEENRRRFGAWNLRLVRGRAPEALSPLPAPDAVFIGGSGGQLEGIVDAALAKNPEVRLCVPAIALETLSAALAVFAARGLDAEVTQIAVSRARPGARLHLLLANNPVFLVTACGGTRP